MQGKQDAEVAAVMSHKTELARTLYRVILDRKQIAFGSREKKEMSTDGS